jgi:EAL domain-containing protein (putative c-di-GMP-specific phosphodiesterase class I)/AmiR/NasT family two-component response regulator
MLPGCLSHPGLASTVRTMASDGTLIEVGAGEPVDPIRVLLADDEPGLRTALTELLSHEDRVELIGTAGDAEEAIRIAESGLPDVALIDVRMPAGGGPHAARGISRVSPGTRVIALSAYEDRANVLEMLRAGAVGYLVKGTAADELVQGIENVAQGGTSLSAEVMSGVVAELATQLRREEIEHEEDQALRGDIERFVTGHGVWMVFQPIVDLETRGEIGVEALARFGSIPMKPPDQWFAAATALELGLQLELRTMREAIAGLSKIPDGVFLALNSSNHTAESPELVDRLEGVERRIVLEITEHEAIEDYGALAEALAPLRERGLRVAVDDVGAGYASLRHALQLAPDMVKMDMSLTRGVDRDPGRRALAAALISFAGETNMTIVAEGIETAEELDALRELGVRYGQGFYFARPAPLD